MSVLGHSQEGGRHEKDDKVEDGTGDHDGEDSSGSQDFLSLSALKSKTALCLHASYLERKFNKTFQSLSHTEHGMSILKDYC